MKKGAIIKYWNTIGTDGYCMELWTLSELMKGLTGGGSRRVGSSGGSSYSEHKQEKLSKSIKQQSTNAIALQARMILRGSAVTATATTNHEGEEIQSNIASNSTIGKKSANTQGMLKALATA